ncbi:filamentous hemagglutinin [[Phormidium ambiguum] IAM M-71]|uniref:Filamentous hemagglutinin n=1 Tax=[Phormidium ambiguum] IAM M-71 TaxID=454136 RepID=A0A1U7I4B2_9CYAN|nr:S-layer family protein [Phormidium ambiguum]OKH31060.1 filamentous hemagglutinin [Phormidium ambiguum IAM M-71]
MNYYLKQLGTISLLLLSANYPLSAQVIPDATLPNNSVVIPQNNSFRIEGGSTSGSNLFHSFSEFSVPTGGEAFFNNAQTIQNIFSRVTGKNISNIDGLIRANGTANLFLINPNGIIFGQNAQLNIGGSFIGSTANSIRFLDGSEFSAVNPTAPSLLTINVPIGLQFGTNSGSIVNQSQTTAEVNLPTLPIPLPFDNKVGLATPPGQTLALIGGDIQLDGGNLTASSGQIHLGSVASPGLVSLTTTPQGLTFNYDNIASFGNIQIFGGSTLNTTGLGGGKVDIRGGNVNFNGGRIYALTLGSIDGRGIDINAQKLRAEGGAQISTLTLGSGAAGAINILATDSVELIGIGFESFQNFVNNYTISGGINPFDPQILLVSSTAGIGDGGNILIETGQLLINDGVVAGSATLGAGNAGDMTIRAGVFDLVGSGINCGTLVGSVGRGGDITFAGERFIVRDGSAIVTITRTEAPAGNINIKASESVEVLRTPDGSPSATLIAATAISINGKAGDINIDTKRLRISDGAGISLSSGSVIGDRPFNTTAGPGGNFTLRATESVIVEGVSGVLANGSRGASFISADAYSASPGGTMQIFTPLLILRDGGLISTASLGRGDAGSITINGGRVEVIGNGGQGEFKSQIQTSVGIASGVTNPNATANGGSLNLNVGQLIIRNGGTVNLQALGTGQAGNINVVGNAIALDNQASIDGRTASGLGANINLQASDIRLRRGSRISTDAGNANGGNITIKTDTLVALENSDITANAIQGSGGRVNITAQGIFGTQFRPALTPQSDITASSDLGAQFSGIVEINTPEVDTSAGLVELPENFTDISNQIVSGCSASPNNSFVITGRGGLPDNPNQTLRSQTVWRDFRSFDAQGRRGAGETGRNSQSPVDGGPQSPIIEATSWKKNADGKVELTAQSAPQNHWYNVPQCGGF